MDNERDPHGELLTEITENSSNPMNQLANFSFAELNLGNIFLTGEAEEICMLVKLQICGPKETHTYILSLFVIIQQPEA